MREGDFAIYQILVASDFRFQGGDFSRLEHTKFLN